MYDHVADLPKNILDLIGSEIPNDGKAMSRLFKNSRHIGNFKFYGEDAEGNSYDIYTEPTTDEASSIRITDIRNIKNEGLTFEGFNDLEQYVIDMAHDDYESGHPVEDFREFSRIIADDGVESTEELWDLYNENFGPDDEV